MLDVLNVLIFFFKMLINSGRGFEGSLWILIGDLLWILPIFVDYFAHKEDGSWSIRGNWVVSPDSTVVSSDMEQIKDVRGSFRSFGWLYWLLLSNSGITFPFWEKVISAWNCSKRSQPLGYFRKRFDYGLQFGLHPGNIRYLEFIWILRRVKGAHSDRLRRGGNGERLKGKCEQRIRMWKQGVEEVGVVQKDRGIRALEVGSKKVGGWKRDLRNLFSFFNCLPQLIYNLHFAER